MDVMSISEISMRNDLAKLDTLSHNVSNLTTPAYKRMVVNTETFVNSLNRFESLSGGNVPLSGAIPTLNQQVDFSSGAIKFSGNPLDLAVEGDGFFQLINERGTFYTKRGDFTLDGSGKLLLSGTNMMLNGIDGDVRLSNAEPNIDALGQVFENDQQVSQLKIVNFKDTSQLLRVGGGVFMAGQGAVPEEVSLPAVRQGYLEASNTQPAEEMLELIKLARHFEATQQVVRGYDGMLETVFEDLGRF